MQGARVVLDAAGQVQIEHFEVPQPGPDQVLVQVDTTMVSAGTEVNMIRQRRGGPQGSFPQAGLGYTAIGRVAAVGVDVDGWQVGERVLCGGNHASHWLVTPHLANSLEAISQQYMIERVPEGLDDVDAAFCVLGDVALQGIRRAQIQIGESVAVHGVGVIGLLAVQLAKISGAYPIVAVDPDSERLELARKLGADHGVDASRSDVVAEIRRLTATPWRFRGALPGLPPDAGADVQIHTTSTIGNYPVLLQAAADRGRIVLVGATSGKVEIDSHELLRRELRILGSYETGVGEPHPYWPWSRPRNRQVIWDLIGRGSLQVEPLVSHVVPYDEAPALYAQMVQGSRGWLGVFFRWNEA